MNEVEEQLLETGVEILRLARNELYLRMRFLDVPLSSFRYVMNPEVETIGTDGYNIVFHPGHLGGLYRENRIYVNRAYLHMVIHCMFRHLTRRRGRQAALWNLACDIAAESLIDSMKHRPVRLARSYERQKTYTELGRRMKVLTAEKIYGALKEWDLAKDRLVRLQAAFLVDSHVFWPEDEDKEKQSEIENRWKDMSEQTETDMETFSKEAASDAGDLLRHVKVENRERFSYKEFLRKFSVYKEEVSVDQDTFDYIFYSYGLGLYGNMPLIEPLEVKEVKKVEQFVIAVDTSMSCSGELVKKFLEQTYRVLREQDSFFRTVNIRIVQCDDQVREDRKITNSQELKAYMEDLTLSGEGGTDFRPVFEYVQTLIENREFTNLKGLIYFTDGLGIYPSVKPSFETAFVFLREDYEEVVVPAWAIKLIVEEADLNEEEEGDKAWI